MKAWRGDWKARALERVAGLGFPSATEFAASHPVASLLKLADMLGEDIAAVHLEVVLAEEATTPAAFNAFARSMLVRTVHEDFPNGWGPDDWARSGVYAHWRGTLGRAYNAQTDLVFNRLEALPPPPGWLPAGPDDPLIVEVFRGIEFPPKYPERKPRN